MQVEQPPGRWRRCLIRPRIEGVATAEAVEMVPQTWRQVAGVAAAEGPFWTAVAALIQVQVRI